MQITSLHNPRVKAAGKLRDRSGREEQGRIIIDGLREIGRALQGGLKLSEVYFLPERCGDGEHERLLQDARQVGAELYDVSPAVMEKLSFGQRLEGIVAVAEQPRRSLGDLTIAGDGLVAVVEGAEKPGNIGAILRTADAAGLSAVIIADGGTDLFNPNAIRASLGAIFTLSVCEATSQAALDWLRNGQFRMFAARVDGAVDYTAANLRGRAAIVLGSEAHGLSDHWRGDDITPIRLPLLGTVDSLNLSATAAVLFYESLRQRQAS
jgi:RNA methyltransferase, TrmH family